MDNGRGPEQPTPPPTAEQIMDQAKQHLRDEPPAMPAHPPTFNADLKNNPPPPPASVPQFNEYGKIENPNTPAQPEVVGTIPEIQNPERDYPGSREDFNHKLQGAAALADAMAALGDQQGAKEILAATLEGKLAGLDNPPDVNELRKLIEEDNWRTTPLIKKIAIALTSK